MRLAVCRNQLSLGSIPRARRCDKSGNLVLNSTEAPAAVSVSCVMRRKANTFWYAEFGIRDTANLRLCHEGEIGKIMKKKLLLLFRRFVPSKRNGGANGNGAEDNKGDRPPQIQWPYVMNSCVPMLGPIVQGSWIWHHHYRRWHHGYYRTRR